ncbi:DNA polymerase III subunit delta' [Caenispirillum bisanense]|uniref:DNA polymerase III, delta prime subunit n=1 Tax=Caenispirillum bisanense TaxID=414052 RepID=A0A286GFH8_9PROT|nr:DNA polymerase III subunit delta' [Caenispirillum bisanense]SOD94285.1 DNA polymerase III, delta prime subunit [Caenispirillum bisanense]
MSPAADAALDDPLLPSRMLDLVGHEAAEREVLDAWTSGRMHHAWLISGPRGIGKATLAYRIARFVLAQGATDAGAAAAAGPSLFGDALPPVLPTSLDLAPDHPVVRRVAAGGHGDLRVIQRELVEDKKTKRLRAQGVITVDAVRGIGHFLSMTSAEGGWRIVLIDGAEEMNRNAANAVLKVLEEPPRRALLLLVSHNPARLLPTIRSRCRRLPLTPLRHAQVVDLLARHKPGLAAADRDALAAMGEGSVGVALDLEEQGGLDLYRDLLALLQGLPKLDVGGLHALAEKLARGDDGFRIASDLFTWWLGRVIRAKGRGHPDPEVLPGEAALTRRLAEAGSLEQWVQVWEKITHLFDRTTAVNLDKKQALISAFLAVERLVRA